MPPRSYNIKCVSVLGKREEIQASTKLALQIKEGMHTHKKNNYERRINVRGKITTKNVVTRNENTKTNKYLFCVPLAANPDHQASSLLRSCMSSRGSHSFIAVICFYAVVNYQGSVVIAYTFGTKYKFGACTSSLHPIRVPGRDRSEAGV